MKHLIGLSHRVAYATATALVGLLLAVMPAGLKIDSTGVLTKLLNLPVAAVGLLLPDGWKSIDLWFGTNALHYSHFSEVLVRHLRLAIPVYVLLFYIPTLGRAVWQRLRHRRRAIEAEAPGRLAM